MAKDTRQLNLSAPLLSIWCQKPCNMNSSNFFLFKLQNHVFYYNHFYLVRFFLYLLGIPRKLSFRNNSLIYACIHLIIHSCIHACFHSIIHPFFHMCFHSIFHPLIHPGFHFVQSLIHSSSFLNLHFKRTKFIFIILIYFCILMYFYLCVRQYILCKHLYFCFILFAMCGHALFWT